MFRKFFLLELKKYWVAILVLSLACIAITAGFFGGMGCDGYFAGGNWGWGPQNPDSFAWMFSIPLMCLAFFVPIFMYSFKMSKRKADLFYSLPISRPRLYLIRSIIGMMLVFIPFTVSFWIGFAILAGVSATGIFSLVYFLPFFFVSVGLGFLLYGFSAFMYTRANHVADGIVLLLFSAAIIAMPAIYVDLMIAINAGSFFRNFGGSMQFFSASPLLFAGFHFDRLISTARPFQTDLAADISMYIVWSIIGLASWAGLFITSRTMKAEDAKRRTTSPFGFSLIIPAIFGFGIAMVPSPISFMTIPAFFLGGYLFYLMFRRTARLKQRDYIILLAAVMAGALLSLGSGFWGRSW